MTALPEALSAAHADVKAEIARTDTKVALLIAFEGAVLAGTATAATALRVPLAARLIAALGIAALLAAVALLLMTARPNLGGARPCGFPRWATLTEEQIRTELEADDRARHIRVLSRIAVAKYGRLRRAIDLTLVGGLLLVVAAALTAGGVS
ncbi:Pycsar system effector family protein [Streptomyces paromomycinus]|uniref:Integral membrane plasmid transfer protein n=1 Tax=Streptomyces paromomycinus TaxID=92743 RepID=A0A401W4B3_STREY|nr:Pycsar system effector family protein [Streptomyces paromomycinus]GCD44146.1 integral membrane plasmid transfer protein [Streptomyces paromomycinus]